MPLTKSEIAARVKLNVQVPDLDKAQKPKLHDVTKVPLTKTEKQDINAEDVLSFRIDLSAGQVFVVTTAGQKLEGALTKAQIEKLEKEAATEKETAQAIPLVPDDDKGQSAQDSSPKQDGE